MIILFVRHAEAVDGKLTELGKKQCELLIEQKEDYTFKKIYSSPVLRCVETAKYLQKKFGVEIEKCDKMFDRIMLERKPANDKEKLWYDNYLNPNFSCDDIEGCKEFLERNFEEFSKIIDKHKDKNENIVIVSHSCTFYALMAYFNKTQNQNINWYRIGNCSKVYFEIN